VENNHLEKMGGKHSKKKSRGSSPKKVDLKNLEEKKKDAETVAKTSVKAAEAVRKTTASEAVEVAKAETEKIVEAETEKAELAKAEKSVTAETETSVTAESVKSATAETDKLKALDENKDVEVETPSVPSEAISNEAKETVEQNVESTVANEKSEKTPQVESTENVVTDAVDSCLSTNMVNSSSLTEVTVTEETVKEYTTAAPVGHTEFSWRSKCAVPIGHTLFSWTPESVA